LTQRLKGGVKKLKKLKQMILLNHSPHCFHFPWRFWINLTFRGPFPHWRQEAPFLFYNLLRGFYGPSVIRDTWRVWHCLVRN